MTTALQYSPGGKTGQYFESGQKSSYHVDFNFWIKILFKSRYRYGNTTLVSKLSIEID